MYGSQMKKQKRIFACDVTIQYVIKNDKEPSSQKNEKRTLYVKENNPTKALEVARKMLADEVGVFEMKHAVCVFHMEEFDGEE